MSDLETFLEEAIKQDLPFEIRKEDSTVEMTCGRAVFYFTSDGEFVGTQFNGMLIL